MPPLTLETFTDDPPEAATEATATAADEARLAGFDAGYAAGWEDAATAHAEDKARTEAATTAALQTLGFTFQEARSHVLAALEPLLAEITAKLLPAIAQATLPALVVDTVLPLAEGLAEPPVTLRLHPDARAAVERLCVPALGLPVTLVEDPSLTPGDIRLTLDTAEARVNLDDTVAALTAAIADFFTLETKGQAHVG